MDKFHNLILDQFKALLPMLSRPVSQTMTYPQSMKPILHPGHQVIHYDKPNLHSPSYPPLTQELMIGADQKGAGTQ